VTVNNELKMMQKETAVAKFRYHPGIVSEGLRNIMKTSMGISSLRARDLNPRPTNNEPVFTHPTAKFGLMMIKIL
jgi:hypothetical protein